MNTNDKLEIQELLARAAYGLDQGDWNLLKACFAEDAVMSVRIKDGDLIGPFEGCDAILKLCIDTQNEQTDQRRHIISNTFFASDNKITSFVTITATENDQIRLVCTGIYHDEVVSVNGEWKVLNRYVHLDSVY